MGDGACVVLVGSMLAGKTTVGREVARELGVPFLDLDHALEERTGRSPRAWIEAEGEEAFRARESELALAALKESAVIAFGGGTYMCPHVRAAAKGHITCYLHLAPAQAFSRLNEGERAKRPLLDGDAMKVLVERYVERDPVFREARYVIDAAASLEDVVTKVVSYA